MPDQSQPHPDPSAPPGDPRRALPQLAALLEAPEVQAMAREASRAEVVDAARAALDGLRGALAPGDPAPANQDVIGRVREALMRRERERLRPIVNATGVILHTGLGRAVLPARAARALAGMDRCCNLQLDMATGQRGKRNEMTERLLCRLTGAEAAMVVNNNAAATLLVLAALCAGREVIVSRGQLIEIGGAFRLPDCVKQSGAILIEVGTTNKTHPRDYEAALSPATGAILRVNPSNYRIIGFSAEVPIGELVAIAATRPGVLAIDDLGCGALVNLEDRGLPHEPTVQESVAAGADLALFSGDKLIGGPQAGIIVGKKELIQKIKKHPLTRMLRVDKMTDLALEQTLRLFLEPETLFEQNPTLRMLTLAPEAIKKRAARLLKRVEALRGAGEGEREASDLTIRAIQTESAVGGGTLPGTPLPSWALAVSSPKLGADAISRRLREHEPPIIARVEKGEVLLDLRTIFEDEEAPVADALAGLG